MEAAAKKVMFISTKETLMTNGLVNKIRNSGLEPYYVYNADQLAAHAEEPHRAVVYYMDDDVTELEELHATLDKLCAAQRSRKVFCIGTQDQYNVFVKKFSPARVAVFFERPLNIERFLKSLVDGPDMTERKQRVLIVDDDASYRQLVRTWLKSKYDVSMANGGTQAISVLSTQACDMVLLDYEMPIVPGPQVMEMIRSLPEGEKLPIIFLTGKDDEACIRRVLELHPDGYLLKTVSEVELLKKVEEVFAETKKA